MEIIIDWSKIPNQEEFYKIFLPQIDAPHWHGENLDAPNDSLKSSDINGVKTPYKIISLNESSAPSQI